MATKKDKSHYLARFYPGGYFHVYGRTNNREPLYRNDDQRQFFLEKYAQYLGDYVDTFAWCLMENHFHLLIRVKDENHLLQYITGIPELMRTAAQQQFLETPPIDRDYHTVLERQFTRLFTTYAMRVNAEQKRSGNLFYRPFKRIEVTDINHLVWLVYYIHSNPVKHGVYTKFSDYRWSSYKAMLSQDSTKIARGEVLEWFGGLDYFKNFHLSAVETPESVEYLDIEY